MGFGGIVYSSDIGTTTELLRPRAKLGLEGNTPRSGCKAVLRVLCVLELTEQG